MIIKELVPQRFGFRNDIRYIRGTMKKYPDLTSGEKKSLRKLLMKKVRDKEGRFLVEGPRVVEEALHSTWKVSKIIFTNQFLSNPHSQRIITAARARKVHIVQAPADTLKAISDAVTSQGVAAVVERASGWSQSFWPDRPKSSLIIALDHVSDPGNLGTIIRTCDWFGVDAILLGQGTAELFNPKTLRSTMGSLFHLTVYADVNLAFELVNAKTAGYSIIATSSTGGNSLYDMPALDRVVLLFGNEARGISQNLLGIADHMLTIPRFGKAESLNVGISCGVILSWMRR